MLVNIGEAAKALGVHPEVGERGENPGSFENPWRQAA